MEVTNIDDFLNETISDVLNDDNLIKQVSFIQSHLENIDKEINTSFYHNQIINSLYTPSISKSSSPIILIALVTFNQKRGSIIESTFPNESFLLDDSFIASLNPKMSPKDILSDLCNQLCQFCLFDGIHLVDSDKEYFLIQNMSEILYCISSYKQIHTNNIDIEDESENKRNYIQKAICIVSTLPLFEYFITQATVAIDSYFSQKSLKDKTVIGNLYDYLTTRSYCQISDYQLVKSFNLHSVLLFCKEKIFALIKLILLEKRIIVYSKVPGDVCGFIFSLLSCCIPGSTLFNYNNICLCYKELGLPLKIFHQFNLFNPLMSISNINSIQNKRSYLIGITNGIILQMKELRFDCVINLDETTITFAKEVNERIIQMSLRESIFYKQLSNVIYKQDIDPYEDRSAFLNHLWLRKQTVYLKENEDIEKIINNYYLNLFFDISLGIELCHKRLKDFNELIFENLLLNESPTDAKSIEKCLMILLSTYHIDFIAQWIQTSNFSQWHKSIFTNYLSYRSIFYKCINSLCIHYLNEDYYIGTLKEGKYHFKGSYYFNDDDLTYIGEWQNNKRHGVGNITNRDNTYLYDGEWENNKKCGTGYLISNGRKYGGGFYNDLFQGKGELIEKEGKRYQGSFIQGKKTGKGKQVLPNGEEYEGLFEDGSYEGNGILTTKDGIKYIGTFIKGNLDGNVEVQFPNNEIHYVVYQNGRNMNPEIINKSINLNNNNNIKS